MTREQYLEKKEELKQWAADTRADKKLFRQWQRDFPGRSSYQCSVIGPSHYFDYRAGHIVMSLLRGRTRIQIENNFEKQDAHDTDLYTLETRIKRLCGQYELDMDLDEKGRVLTVEQKVVVEEKIGA